MKSKASASSSSARTVDATPDAFRKKLDAIDRAKALAAALRELKDAGLDEEEFRAAKKSILGL